MKAYWKCPHCGYSEEFDIRRGMSIYRGYRNCNRCNTMQPGDFLIEVP